jgi:hypothetical protein
LWHFEQNCKELWNQQVDWQVPSSLQGPLNSHPLHYSLHSFGDLTERGGRKSTGGIVNHLDRCSRTEVCVHWAGH